jgi:hypothetical protein
VVGVSVVDEAVVVLAVGVVIPVLEVPEGVPVGVPVGVEELTAVGDAVAPPTSWNCSP